MFMTATVIRTDARSLLVRDNATGTEVLVFFNNARNFSPGDQVRITYNGVMTPSVPPQITATSIQRLGPSRPSQPSQPSIRPSELRRAVVLQVRQNSLVVRDPGNNNRQVVVNFAFARHFCVGQRLNIQYNSISLGNPIQVNATNIVPLC